MVVDKTIGLYDLRMSKTENVAAVLESIGLGSGASIRYTPEEFEFCCTDLRRIMQKRQMNINTYLIHR